MVSLETIVSFAKRRGFIFPGSEIYGGFAGTYDFGPHGLALKKNIEQLWWRRFVELRDDMYGIDSAILMSPRVWEASGHTTTFNDPLVVDQKTQKRYRADHLLEEAGIDPTGMSTDQMSAALKEKGIQSPEGNPLSEVQQFNMMFKTSVGSVEGGEMPAYLRPETAQGMFVNFKNIIDSYHPKLPFGIAQIGRAFRNEIAPREFIFRVRELEIMELEYFLEEKTWEEQFAYWQKEMHAWFKEIGFSDEDVKEVEVSEEERAHYSKRTLDFYFKYPGGFKEIGGLAYRTDFDLKNHEEASGAELRYLDQEKNEKISPHVLEPTFGLGRHVLAVLVKAYDTDSLGGEERVVLRLPAKLAPVKALVSPLLKNKPELVAKAQEVRRRLQEVHPAIAWDDNGNIGKRYRRQDEIGTPFCITVDFDTLGESPELTDTVTLRHRDTGEQERLFIEEVAERLTQALK
ncbi:glycine--tRNA ligase [Patescibacteria group bacterium]|nr:glycine--tRNA ligase [Patescibacteria group bacterium]MBU1500652.1 glycine--tRNA ligase [Patescibacteria group bacterium]MBU2080395.1 glycine--tRNA ligase [Patescibacteria group bacterium]MBU2124193.1 glycine--tRNA ligase [Patescibacteria group bacterium]MBU2194356.1 glycine--tRNA ligase [Patescibacteria group bacterium]